MAQDIKQKIVLEGEKEYREALKSAQRNLKTLRSELKAETAELGKNATEQQKAEAKAKSLQKQIKEQERVVQAYKEALAEVKEKYGDNEEALAKYEQKLNDARATLANMKSSLDDVSGGFQAIDDGASRSVLETKALADSFSSISENAGAMASAMEGVFTGVVETISMAIGAVWGELMEVAGKADEYFDLGAFLGASATEVQKWSKALEYAGADISTVTNLISRLKYGGKAEKVTEWFGISDENYTNDLLYFEALMKEMYKAKQEMSDADWGQAMTDIFGARKTQELDSLLSDWNDILDGLKENDVDNGGKYGLTEEELEDMAELNVMVMKLKSNWESLKEMAVVRLFGDLALNLTSNAQGALDALVELMDAKTPEEREAAIKKLEDNLTQAFEAIGKAIEDAAKALDEAGAELQGSENGYVRLIGNLMSGLSDVLEWMARPDALDTITKFLEGFFALWAGAKATSAVGNLAALLNNVGLIGGGAVSGAAAKSAGTAIGASWGAGFASAVMKAAPWLVGLYTLLNPGTSQDSTAITQNNEKLWNDYTAGMTTPEREKLWNEIWGQKYTERTLGLTETEINAVWEEMFREYLLNNQPNTSENTHPGGRVRNIQGVGTITSGEEAAEGFFSSMERWLNNPAELKLPAWLYSNQQSKGLTSDDINTFTGLPAQMARAVANSVSGITVNLDGRAVGNLVAPYVSQYIVRDVPIVR